MKGERKRKMPHSRKSGATTESSLDLLEIWKSISYSWKALNRDVERALSSTGLSLAEVRVLHTLHTSGVVPMTKLTAELMVTPGAITSIVDGLESLGLVERVRDEDDRRVITIRITEKGGATIKKAIQLHKRYISKKFRALSMKQILLLDKLLGRLAKSSIDELFQ